MTIAIGLLAKDGIVIAADTQETVGSMKMDESKVLVANRGIKKEKSGALVISGAGEGGYLDTANQEICELFLKRRWKKDSFSGAIKKHVKKFHSDHVVPFSNLPSYERPELSLILGAQIGNDRLLLESDKSTVHPCRNYAAVGIGHTYARAMLRKYWIRTDIIKTTSLAAYVMFHVKNNVEGCGNETQIVILKEGHAEYLSDRNVSLLEYSFQEYQADEVLSLHFVLGLDLREANMEAELTKFKWKLKHARNEIATAQRFTMTGFRAGVRPVDQPEIKPSSVLPEQG